MSYVLENGFIDFAKITPQTLRAFFDADLANAEQALAALINTPSAPTFTNTLLPIERLLTTLTMHDVMALSQERAFGDAYSEVNTYIETTLEAFCEKIWQDPTLYARVQTLASQPYKRTTQAQKMVDRACLNFRRYGYFLDADQKSQVSELKKQILELQGEYAKNMRATSAANILYLDENTDLTGVNPQYIEAAKKLAENNEKPNMLAFAMVGKSATNIMEFCQNAEVRKQAYHRIALAGDDNPNWHVSAKMASLRLNLANLLGYPDYVSYKLADNRMAKSHDQVLSMIGTMYPVTHAAAQSEVSNLQTYATQDGLTKMQAWDYAYYRRVALESELQVDLHKIKEYFSLDNIIQGVFARTKQMLGIDMVERHDLKGFADDNRVYEMRDDNGNIKAWVVMDLYRRTGFKKNGGWVSSLTRAHIDAQGNKQIPVCTLSTNYDKTEDGSSILLDPIEASTMFHEMGHILDYTSSRSPYASQAPASGPWDTVEIPSMFFENFWATPEFINGYLTHHETGETLSADAVGKIIEMDKKLKANGFLRQLRLTNFDMAVHSIHAPITADSMKDLQNNAFEPYKIFKTDVLDYACDFMHIFQGKYDSGYYSYWWAASRAYSLYETFEQSAGNDKALNKLFKDRVLGQTPFLNMDEVYAQITGKPTIDNKALLSRFGITGG